MALLKKGGENMRKKLFKFFVAHSYGLRGAFGHCGGGGTKDGVGHCG